MIDLEYRLLSLPKSAPPQMPGLLVLCFRSRLPFAHAPTRPSGGRSLGQSSLPDCEAGSNQSQRRPALTGISTRSTRKSGRVTDTLVRGEGRASVDRRMNTRGSSAPSAAQANKQAVVNIGTRSDITFPATQIWRTSLAELKHEKLRAVNSSSSGRGCGTAPLRRGAWR
jgi:hypothetical protein